MQGANNNNGLVPQPSAAATPTAPGKLRAPSSSLFTPPCQDKMTLVFLLDRTGSMSDIRRETVLAYNEFLMLMTDKAPKGTMTLVQFDDEEIEGLYWEKPMAEALMLTPDAFQPRDMTNLWDAVGWTANRVGRRDDEERKVFVVLSDGQENASERWDLPAVRELVADYMQHGWTFVMLATGSLDREAAEAMGFPDGNTYVFDQSNVKAAVEKLGGALAKMLGSGQKQTKALFLEHQPTSPPDNDGGAIAL